MNLSPIDVLVRDRIGLDTASLGPAVLPRAVRTRMAIREVTSEDSYSGLLTADPVEWAALLAELLVPETWFFRGGRPLFDHLAAWVRERLTTATTADPVRILSAPCSTGEEPYSLAIALDDQGVPPAAYRIDGVDLSADHLARAVAGAFPAYAFREPAVDPRPRCFTPGPDGRSQLLPRYRDAVRFRVANLFDPAVLVGELPYDLILCRNLFIYLTTEGRTRVLGNLDRLLAAGGRLCLTPAEADRLPASRFTADGPPGFAIFRRAATGGPGSGTIPVQPASGRIPIAEPRANPGPVSGRIPKLEPYPASGPSSSRIVLPEARPAAGPPSGRIVLPEPGATAGPPSGRIPALEPRAQPPSGRIPIPATPPVPPEATADPRALADAGRLTEALAACEALIKSRPPSADLFSLLGVIHLAAGRTSNAAEALRKALYLDPDHPEALTHMIVLHEKRGEHEPAAALRRRLARVGRREPA